jgi:ER membrane protein complex subunit 1
MRVLFALTAVLSASVLAVFEDEAFHIDYHHALLGQPLEDATFFHQPFANSRASLIYSLSDHAVLGAVNPKDGSLVWRQILPEATNSSTSILRTAEGRDTVYTAFDGQVAAWGASDGRLAWRYTFEEARRVRDVEVLDMNGSQGTKDIVVLVGGEQPSVIRLDVATGSPVWTYADAR